MPAKRPGNEVGRKISLIDLVPRDLVPGIRIDLFEMAAQVLPAKMRKHRRPWKHRACSKEKYSTFKHGTESG
jgi:hypothetical protein